MKSENLMDLEQITQDVFKTEEMLAYAVLRIVAEDVPPLEGFCKISRPKKESGLKYFSVLYIIDTPDEKSRNAATQLTSKIDWKQLQEMLPEVEDEMGIPHKGSSDNFFMEREIFMKNSDCLTKEYIYFSLYPTLVQLTGFLGNDLLFWDSETRSNVPPPSMESHGNLSLIDRLKAFLPF